MIKVKGKITFIQILLIFVVIICGINIYDKISDNKKSEKHFENISIQTSSPSDAVANDDSTQRLRKCNELYQINSDTAGWVKIYGTNIDYPVMHSSQSNAYYLHRNFDKEESDAGIPFLDYQCDPQFADDNTIIYAHNMKNGTMFHDLLNYKDKSFYDEHKEVEYDTLYETGVYEIYAVLRTSVGSADEFKYYEFINANTKEEFDAFVSECINRSMYDTGIVPQYGDKLLTLSTCSYNTNNERFVVFARKKV